MIVKLEELLRQINGIIDKKTKEKLSEFNLTLPRFFALYIVDKNKGISMGDLRQKLYLANSTVTGIIDGLVKDGLVQRERDPNDRRVVRITITPKGEELLTSIIKVRRNFLEQAIDGIDQNELSNLIDVLTQLQQAVKQISS